MYPSRRGRGYGGFGGGFGMGAGLGLTTGLLAGGLIGGGMSAPYAYPVATPVQYTYPAYSTVTYPGAVTIAALSPSRIPNPYY